MRSPRRLERGFGGVGEHELGAQPRAHDGFQLIGLTAVRLDGKNEWHGHLGSQHEDEQDAGGEHEQHHRRVLDALMTRGFEDHRDEIVNLHAGARAALRAADSPLRRSPTCCRTRSSTETSPANNIPNAPTEINASPNGRLIRTMGTSRPGRLLATSRYRKRRSDPPLPPQLPQMT